MNESIFFGHILVMLLFLLLSLRLGKKGLFAFIALSAVLANFLVLKQMVLFGLTVTCTDVYMVGSFLGLGLVQELYGKKTALDVSTICFFALGFFLIMGQIHLLYTPAPNELYHGAYQAILRQNPRMIIVSITSILLSQRIQVFFYSLFAKLSLKMRLFLSTAISQTFDTLFFATLALWGIAHHLLHIIGFSLLVKAIILTISTPVTSFILARYANKAKP